MTIYHVDIYNPNIAGAASDQDSLVAALKAAEKFFKSGDCVNAGWCEECKRKAYADGSPLYHTFMIREQVALEIVTAGRFTWTKKKGIGRQTQVEYLEGLIKSGRESWFQLEMSEI